MASLVDVVQYLVVIVDVAKPLVGGLFPLPLPPGYPAKPDKNAPTYVGAAVVLQPERSSLDVFISAAAVHQAYKAFVAPLLGN